MLNEHRFQRGRSTAVLLMGLVLAGCAAPIADQAFQDVTALAQPRVGHAPTWIRNDDEARAVRTKIEALLAAPLGPDEAVALALLNNQRLQGAYAELGIGAAELAQSWRPENPGISFARLKRGSESEIERGVGINALSLIFFPVVAQIEARRFEHAKLETANRILEVALEACKAWYQATAARQTVRFIEEIQETAAIQAELARRMRAAGNWSALDQAREHLFYADMTAQLTLARLAENRTRERLIRALGLWGSDLSFALKDRLPDIPTSPRPEEGIEATAVAQRLDLRMAMAEIEGLSRALGLTRTTRFINVLETSYLRNSETDKPRQTGYEISLEIPIFDFGDAKVAKAEAIYMQAVARLGEKAVNARSVVRESYVNYRAAYDLAVHYNREIVPLRQRVSEELMLRYNGMLVSVFELLADARDRIASVVSAIDAQRDFWIADAELSFATVAALDATEGQIGGRAIGTTRSARH